MKTERISRTFVASLFSNKKIQGITLVVLLKLINKKKTQRKRNGQFKTLTSVKYVFQIFEDHLDAIRDNSKQLRRLLILGQWVKPAQVK